MRLVLLVAILQKTAMAPTVRMAYAMVASAFVIAAMRQVSLAKAVIAPPRAAR